MMANVVIENGVVVGIFARPQPDLAGFTTIPDDDARLVAFQASFSPAKPRYITPTQFLNRIPPASLPVLWSNPQTGVMLITLAAANVIDLDDPSVQGGVNSLVPAILTPAQAAAILDH